MCFRFRGSISLPAMLLGLAFLTLAGCGRSGGTTLIEPTVVYELTEQEKVNLRELEAARAGR